MMIRVQELCRKLQPVLGRRVDRLWSAYLAESDASGNATNLVEGDTNGAGDVFVREISTGRTIRVSLASDGAQANGGSSAGRISDDGRYVVFESAATNLVAGDTNGVGDIFVRDLITGKTTCVSVATDGSQANKLSHLGSISADGRFVAFYSDATNLAPNLPRKGYTQVFVRDCWLGVTRLVSVAPDGTTPGNNWSRYPKLSADGSLVVFQSVAPTCYPPVPARATSIFATS